LPKAGYASHRRESSQVGGRALQAERWSPEIGQGDKPIPPSGRTRVDGQGYAEAVFGEFKAKFAFEAIKGEQTLAELVPKYAIHHTMIAQWKRQVTEGMTAAFSGKAVEPEATGSCADVETLHAKIGQLLVERDFLRDASARWGLIRRAK